MGDIFLSFFKKPIDKSAPLCYTIIKGREQKPKERGNDYDIRNPYNRN